MVANTVNAMQVRRAVRVDGTDVEVVEGVDECAGEGGGGESGCMTGKCGDGDDEAEEDPEEELDADSFMELS